MANESGHNNMTSFYLGESSNAGADSRDSQNAASVVVVGVCAMSKKSQARPMLEILDRLRIFDSISIVVFSEAVILGEPIEKWPVCDCLISFHSKGFPLDKAVRYAELRKPMVINDLYMQYEIQDRRSVYQQLEQQGVPLPRYALLDRTSNAPQTYQVMETEDSIEINNDVFHKPFVEKPISAEDHNVYIYFPQSAGGGSQRLFRKIGSRSSVYSPVSTVRRTGSFIYEEFMATDGTDVKVYTVGPDYAHAEARKSPALDGKVERDKDGKEVRYPIILTAAEKLIARKVCLGFKQCVCGFDLLRANGTSYVCDVNGFSFVKTSPKYYDDCAVILGNMILRRVAPHLPIPFSINYQTEQIPIVPTTYGTMMELRCVIAVIRHGDRTPKQKMKMEVRHKRFFELFAKYGGFKSGQLKLKRPKQLQEILDIARFLLGEISSHCDPEIEEKVSKLQQLKAVLEMYGHFSGINRKVQMKYQPHGAPRRSSDDDDTDYETCSQDHPNQPSLVLILKWGGELTPAGKIQAEKLGQAFRCMYPGGEGDYGQSPGVGLLRLHSTYRHDLKIYASDEGRVQMTGAGFAKGLLDLEGELTPIMVQMVKSANMNGLLDNDYESPKYQRIVKEKLQSILNVDRDFTDDDKQKLAPTGGQSLTDAMNFIGNPMKTCERIHAIICRLREGILELRNTKKADEMKLYHGESWELMIRRWSKLAKDFRMKTGEYDISKIPDIYDCIKYDLQHNMKTLRFIEAEELHAHAKAMADVVIPQEYGITKVEKLHIAQCICAPLLRKILGDLQRNVEEESTRLDSRYSTGVCTPDRHVKTRLYFTSESHIHSLLTVLRYGCQFNEDLEDKQWARSVEYLSAIPELNYMTQIVIMLYEDPTKDVDSDERFHIELHFSPGAYTCGQTRTGASTLGYRTQFSERKTEVPVTETEDQTTKEMTPPPPLDSTPPMVFPHSSSTATSPATATTTTAPVMTTVMETSKPMNCPLSPPRARHQSGGVTELKDSDETRAQSFDDKKNILTVNGSAFQHGSRSQSLEDDLQKKHLENTKKDIKDKEDVRRCSFLGLFSQSLLGDKKGLEGWRVPSIRPLETLHNSLTLKRMENLMQLLTHMTFRSPTCSPRQIRSAVCAASEACTMTGNAAPTTPVEDAEDVRICSIESEPPDIISWSAVYANKDHVIEKLKKIAKTPHVDTESSPPCSTISDDL